ncbi:hypothetical protein HYDPIDRAFT_110775 [Hydnomerulius pinastri MD-312]|nr:hypothetical protein HYDPIDRAFT_110775 [Hydnomerulius pinastri MD-312]
MDTRQPHRAPAVPLDTSLRTSSPASLVHQVWVRIEKKIAALYSARSTLRTGRSQLSSISRLPPEILAAIFVQYARIWCSSFQGETRIPPWVGVSHVCRHWRAVALDCPTLWAHLFFSSRRWTEELIVRSKNVPLIVHINRTLNVAPSNDFFANVQKALMHIERIQVLHINSSKPALFELFSKPAPAPLLRSLVISTIAIFPGDLSLDLDDVLHPETPGLRALQLFSCDITSSSPFISGLRSLILIDPPSLLTIPELSRLLRRMPHLVDLGLYDALDCHQGRSLPSFVVASVDSLLLRSFAVRSPVPDTVALLRYLRIPLSTEVKLCCTGKTTREFLKLAPFIAERFEHNLPGHQVLPLPPIVRSLKVHAVRHNTGHGVGFIYSILNCDSERDDRLKFQWESGAPLQVELNSKDSSLFRGVPTCITAFCCNLALPNIQYLSISSRDTSHDNSDDTFALSGSFWRDTFGHMQTLRAIKLTKVNLQGFVEVLSPPRHGGSAERSASRDAPDQDLAPVMGEIPESLHASAKDLPKHLPQQQAPTERPFAHEASSQVFAPALTEIRLISVAFSLNCPSHSIGSSVDFNPCLECLRDALTHRKNAGFGLQKLVLTDCMYVPNEEVVELKEVVGEVQWDDISGISWSNRYCGGWWRR